MAKGYSARRGFSNGSGKMLKQQQMQQQIMKMQEDMQKAQQEVERLLQSGQMSQAQFQELRQQAEEFARFLK